jgi:hypothetical protein
MTTLSGHGVAQAPTLPSVCQSRTSPAPDPGILEVHLGTHSFSSNHFTYAGLFYFMQVHYFLICFAPRLLCVNKGQMIVVRRLQPQDTYSHQTEA